MGWSRSLLAGAALSPALALFGCTVYTRPAEDVDSTPPDTAVRSGRAPALPPPAPVEEAFPTFDQVLSPYGRWLDQPVCGGYFGRVWQPFAAIVGRDFVPYQTGGEWVYTNLGWSFESDWEWGWVPFHYGRWCADAAHGWVWVPGDEWAPAWVDWRMGGDYVGWAPQPPPGVGLVSPEVWVFVERRELAGGRPVRHGLPPGRVDEARRITRPVNRVITHEGRAWSAGPPPIEIRGSARTEARPVHIVPPRRGEVRRVIVRRH